MAQPTYTYKVNTPFAINGSKDEIPTTTEDGSVSLENGYGTLYETPPSEGGRFIRRGEWNYLINFLYNAVKELQDIITAGEFTVSASQTLTSILPIALGGTGADTPEQARNNIGLGNVNNTSDLNKPISTATQEALNGKLNLTGGTINGNLAITGEITEQGHRLAAMPSNSGTIVGGLIAITASTPSTMVLPSGGSFLALRMMTSTDSQTIVSTQIDNFSGGDNVSYPGYNVYGWAWRTQ